MPTLWKWTFCEGITTKGRGGEQRAYAGDNVVVLELRCVCVAPALYYQYVIFFK